VTDMSKIQSESNSQPNRLTGNALKSVTDMSKIQSESNSQQQRLGSRYRSKCDRYVKDTI